MAAKKYYAVKQGRETGIFHDWDTCKAAVEGYSGAEYKGFVRLEDAEKYLGGEAPAGNGGAGKDSSGNGTAGKFASENRAAEADGKTKKRAGSRRGAKAGNAPNLSRRAPRRKVQEKTGEEKGPETEPQRETARPKDRPPEGTLFAYVDGSYDHSLKKYAFGCVFILPDGRIKLQYGNGDNALSLQQRNVAGEMLGAMYAVRTAMVSGFSKIEIRYDYEGIEKWVTGAWHSRTELTRKYADAMRRWGENIIICFTKVAAHSNVYYNEMADRTAKAGLREGDGVPKVCHVEEL